MQKQFFAALIVLTLLLCAGCGAQKQESAPVTGAENSATQPANPPADDTAKDVQSDGWQASFPVYRSAEEAANAEYINTYPFFILHDGSFYHLKPTKFTYDAYSNTSASPIVNALPLKGAELPALNLAAGDQLVTFSARSSTYELIPLTDLGACLPVTWQAGTARKLLAKISGSNPAFRMIPNRTGSTPDNVVTEIQGKEITPYADTQSGQSRAQYEEKVRAADDNFCATLKALNIPYLTINSTWNNGSGLESGTHHNQLYIMQGNYGDTITLGQYQGTQYVESQFTLTDTLYQFRTESTQTAATERTHNGYFVVQLPENADGLYAVQHQVDSGVAQCFAFSVSK